MQFPLLNVLYFYISTFRNVCAVSSMTVFCSFLNSCFRGVLLVYFMNHFVVVPFVPVIGGITFYLHPTYLLLLLLCIMETREIVCTDGADCEDDGLTG